MIRYAPLAVMLIMAAFPAYAQQIDAVAGTNNIVQLLLQILGGIALFVFAFMGIQAMSNREYIIPAVVALVIGMGLVFGPYYYFQHFGVTGAAGGGGSANLL